MKAENNGVYVLGNTEFDSIRSLVYANTGINLSPSKMELVKRRFTPRLKALGMKDFGEYVKYLEHNFNTEESHFCNAITTNLTSFFREKHHFEMLKTTVLPELLKQRKGDQKIRIWSAGCSTGQEAYCLAVTLCNTIPDVHKRNIRILATDLDENCLTTAKEGSYPVKEFENVPDSIIKSYFTHNISNSGKFEKEVFTAKDNLKSLITFNKLNLMHEWPMKGPFDIIFCRNVFIYFDKATQHELLKGFSSLQDNDGYLCLGHSEIISNPVELGYTLVEKTAYRKNRGRV